MTAASSVLSRQLQAQLGPNALSVPNAQKTNATTTTTTATPKSKLTRKQRKRLEQLEYKRATEVARAQLIASLESKRLDTRTLASLQSSVAIGDSRTKRQRSASVVRDVRAGVTPRDAQSIQVAARRDAAASNVTVESDGSDADDHHLPVVDVATSSKKRRAGDSVDSAPHDEDKAHSRALELSKRRAQRKRAKQVRRIANADADDTDDDSDDNQQRTSRSHRDTGDDDIDSSEEHAASTLTAESAKLVAAPPPPPTSTGFDFGSFTFASAEQKSKQPRQKRRAPAGDTGMSAAVAAAVADAAADGTAKSVVAVPRAAKVAVTAAAKKVFSKGEHVVVRINEPSRGELDANQLDALMENVDVGDSDSDADDAVGGGALTADDQFGLADGNAAKVELANDSAVKLSAPKVQLRVDKTPYVVIDRDPALAEARRELPILAEEYRFLELLMQHDTVVVCGETGSGKTTQVPQFLLEAGFACDVGVAADAAVGSPDGRAGARIGVTQPRRVAAESVARRVMTEVGAPVAPFVGYQVRHRRAVNEATRIKFMTDGILLRELQSDFLLSAYSVVVLDEAHERTLNTDVLIGLLSRVTSLRRSMFDARERSPSGDAVYPLKLVIMSATLRVSDFVENKRLFAAPPPILQIAGRQHKVTVHFNKVTAANYVGEAYKKLVKLHRQVPSGGVLVFLAGQQEIDLLTRKLRTEFSKAAALEAMREAKREERDKAIDADPSADPALKDAPIVADESDLPHSSYLDVVPLYSRLTPEQQQRAFADVPLGARRCVLATNVAETSLTLPHIKYVIDAGRHKVLLHDARSGVSRYVVDFVSQASAAQRAGRAGRVSEGHAYRLYSSALFANEMPEFDEPEVLRMPVGGVVLQMKSMGIRDVTAFPFPTPPPPRSLAAACESLFYLGALGGDRPDEYARNAITPLGRLMARFPVTPRMAKILVLGNQYDCLEYAIALVAALTVQSPLLRVDDIDYGDADDADADAGAGAGARVDEARDEARIRAAAAKADVDPYERRAPKKSAQKLAADKRRQRTAALVRAQSAFFDVTSDALTAMRAAGAFEFAMKSKQDVGMAAWCGERRVMYRVLKEMHDLRQQLTAAAADVIEEGAVRERLVAGVDANLPPPSAAQCGVLRQLVCAGFCDRVARLRRVQEPNAGTPNGPPLLYDTVLGAELAVDVRTTLVGTEEEREAREARQLDGVAVHPASIVRRNEPPPEFVVYTELLRTEKRTWMRGCTVVEARWLAALLGPFVQFGAPLELPRPHYRRELDSVVCHVAPTVAPIGWPLPACERPMPESRERCRWFAVALLRGDVCPALVPLAERLTSAPALAVRPHVPASKAGLIAALTGAGIATRAQLDDCWARVPSFLLGEYLAWLERDCHDAVKAAWPPTDDELRLELPPLRPGAGAAGDE